MPEIKGTSTFTASSQAYDEFMGRYSRQLAPRFADVSLPEPGGRFLDVGCGPGSLTEHAVSRLGAGSVAAADPAPGFVAACRHRLPGVDVRCAPAEDLPFGDNEFDAVAAQLVFHFVTDPDRATAEMARVVHPGGRVAACVWDFHEGMQMLRAFWDAALTLDPEAPDEARTLRFGAPGELTSLFEAAGLAEVREATVSVAAGYTGFEELWAGFLGGIGPAGNYTVTRSLTHRAALREAFAAQLGNPQTPFTLTAVARVVHARTKP